MNLPPVWAARCCRAVAVSALAIGCLSVAAARPSSAATEPAPASSELHAGQTVPPARLERAIQRHLAKRWAGQITAVTVHVTAPRSLIRLPEGRLAIRVAPLAKVVRPGPARFRASLIVNGRAVRRLTVAVAIEAYARVTLTSRSVQRGELLTAADVKAGEWRIRAIEHGLVVSPDEAIGKRAQVAIPPNRPIPRVALELP